MRQNVEQTRAPGTWIPTKHPTSGSVMTPEGPQPVDAVLKYTEREAATRRVDTKARAVAGDLQAHDKRFTEGMAGWNKRIATETDSFDRAALGASSTNMAVRIRDYAAKRKRALEAERDKWKGEQVRARRKLTAGTKEYLPTFGGDVESAVTALPSTREPTLAAAALMRGGAIPTLDEQRAKVIEQYPHLANQEPMATRIALKQYLNQELNWEEKRAIGEPERKGKEELARERVGISRERLDISKGRPAKQAAAATLAHGRDKELIQIRHDNTVKLKQMGAPARDTGRATYLEKKLARTMTVRAKVADRRADLITSISLMKEGSAAHTRAMNQLNQAKDHYDRLNETIEKADNSLAAIFAENGLPVPEPISPGARIGKPRVREQPTVLKDDMNDDVIMPQPAARETPSLFPTPETESLDEQRIESEARMTTEPTELVAEPELALPPTEIPGGRAIEDALAEEPPAGIPEQAGVFEEPGAAEVPPERMETHRWVAEQLGVRPLDVLAHEEKAIRARFQPYRSGVAVDGIGRDVPYIVRVVDKGLSPKGQGVFYRAIAAAQKGMDPWHAEIDADSLRDKNELIIVVRLVNQFLDALSREYEDPQSPLRRGPQ